MIVELSLLFKCFADESRLKILVYLRDTDSSSVNKMADELQISQSALSHQLKLLKDCGLVKCDRLGRTVFYSLCCKQVVTILNEGADHIQHKRAS